MIEDPAALVAIVTGLTALAFFLEGRFAWARSVGSSLLVIVSAAALSNLGIVAPRSPVYDAITGPVTSLAIVWLLFAVDLSCLKAAGPRMLGAFALASVATAAGVLVAVLWLGDAFPEDGWRLAAVMTGTYTGGGLNFVAVGRAVELPDSLFVAATAADNVMTAVWIGATLMLPFWLGRAFRRRSAGPAPTATATGNGEPERVEGFLSPVTLHPVALLELIALGFALILASETLAKHVPAVPAILWLTTLALAAAQIPHVRRLEGAMQLGLIALNLFFAIIGIYSRIGEILRVGPEVFYFTAVVVLVHGTLVYGAGYLLRLDVATVSVASQAAVGGASSAMALAVARNWRDLVLPGTIVGLLGYALGNYAGLAMAALVRDVLGN